MFFFINNHGSLIIETAVYPEILYRSAIYYQTPARCFLKNPFNIKNWETIFESFEFWQRLSVSLEWANPGGHLQHVVIAIVEFNDV